MGFNYSSFISYRHDSGDEKFYKNFKAIIESEAHKVTNISTVFWDTESITWGKEFDERIYFGINRSYFFIPIYHNTYLHEDNIWCARELYHALEVEKKIREKTKTKYSFIYPIIFRGSLNSLPSCIEKKIAREISQLETTIVNNKTTERLTEFKRKMYNIFLDSFRVIENFDLIEILNSINPPSDEEIKVWIKEQKEYEREAESAHLPVLKNNEQ